MSEPADPREETLARISVPRSFIGRAIWIAVAMACLYPLAGLVAGWSDGLAGWGVVAVAAVVCLVTSVLALWVSKLISNPQLAVASLYAAMFCRTGLTFLAGLGLQMQGGVFARIGVFGWIVVFYFVGLVLEIVFALADGQEIQANATKRAGESTTRTSA